MARSKDALDSDRGWVSTTIRITPHVRRGLMEYCAAHQISMTTAVLKALCAMGVKIEEEDLAPFKGRGRHVADRADVSDVQKVRVPLRIRKYVRFRAAQKGLPFHDLILLGLRELGINVPDSDISQDDPWNVAKNKAF